MCCCILKNVIAYLELAFGNSYSCLHEKLYLYQQVILCVLVFLEQSQREMFLMRKNHLDFRTLAQTLAMDKDKLEHYIKVNLL